MQRLCKPKLILRLRYVTTNPWNFRTPTCLMINAGSSEQCRRNRIPAVVIPHPYRLLHTSLLDQGNPEEENQQLAKDQGASGLLPRVLREYWPVAVGVHMCISLASLGTCYMIVSVWGLEMIKFSLEFLFPYVDAFVSNTVSTLSKTLFTSTEHYVASEMKAVGEHLLPGVKAAGEHLLPGVKAAGELILPEVKTVGKLLSPEVKAVGDLLLPEVKAAGELLLPEVKAAGEHILPTVKAAGERILPTVKAIEDQLFSETLSVFVSTKDKVLSAYKVVPSTVQDNILREVFFGTHKFASTLAMAYILNKVLLPVRALITICSVSFIARYPRVQGTSKSVTKKP